MDTIPSVRDAEVKDKKVLLRVDFNVPLSDTGEILDDSRIRAALPTIELLHGRGAHIIIASHLGRPEGAVVEGLRMAPVEKKLKELFPEGADIEVLENLRFEKGEEANDSEFSKQLAAHADLYVGDAFADMHREHASIVGVPKLIPAYLGLLAEKEVTHLTQALTPPPGAVAVFGGTKFETKIPLIEKMIPRYSKIFLGGVLGNDLLKYRGFTVGSSALSAKPVPMDIAGEEKIFASDDIIVREGDNSSRESRVTDVRLHEAIVDIGPTTSAKWSDEVTKAPFVLWNGPMGLYESGFTEGTDALAHAVAHNEGTSVVGGGDTLAAIHKTNFNPEKVFLSTGGGAMLQFLADGTLPGLEALKK